MPVVNDSVLWYNVKMLKCLSHNGMNRKEDKA